MRIASYNVHGFVGRDRRRNPERTAEVVRELCADVVALQEVEARGAGRRAAHPLHRIATSCGFEPVPGPTIVRPDGDYGNALLTRLHPTAVSHHDISVPGREPRGILEVEIAAPEGRMRVMVTHLGLARRERGVQVACIAELARLRHELPLVLLGDLNEWCPLGAARRVLRRELGRSPAPATFPAPLPVLALDRVWCRPASALRSLTVHHSPVAAVASDHLPVVARLAPAKP